MPIDCESLAVDTFEAQAALDAANTAFKPLQEEFDLYVAVDERTLVQELEQEIRELEERLEASLAEMDEEARLLGVAQAAQRQAEADLERLLAENDAVVLRLQELDDARAMLEAEIADLWGVLQPDAQLEDAKAALDLVRSEFDALLARLDALAQEIGETRDRLDALDDEIAAHVDRISWLSSEFEDRLTYYRTVQDDLAQAIEERAVAEAREAENGWGSSGTKVLEWLEAKYALEAAQADWAFLLAKLYAHCPGEFEEFADGDVPDSVWETPIVPSEEEEEEEPERDDLEARDLEPPPNP